MNQSYDYKQLANSSESACAWKDDGGPKGLACLNDYVESMALANERAHRECMGIINAFNGKLNSANVGDKRSLLKLKDEY